MIFRPGPKILYRVLKKYIKQLLLKIEYQYLSFFLSFFLGALFAKIRMSRHLHLTLERGGGGHVGVVPLWKRLFTGTVPANKKLHHRYSTCK